MAFGALVIIFLFGFGLFGLALQPSIEQTATTEATVGTVQVGMVPLTQADTGASVELARDNTGQTLRLSHRWKWAAPEVQGGAIRLTPVNYLRDPGFDEWTIEPVKKGTATITATGRPGPRKFRVTVRIG